jgi:integrase/recombinase XerC
MINSFLQYIQYEKKFSSYTVLSYHTDIKQFLLFLGVDEETFNPDEVSPGHIREWILELTAQSVSARSISRKISTLKSLWRFLMKRSFITKNPLQKIIIPRTKKPLPVFFREKEVNQVLENPFVPAEFDRQRDLLIIELFYVTGIRLSELINISINDINIESGELRVTGKRNKQRMIPLGEVTIAHIKSYIILRNQLAEKEDRLLLRTNGKNMYPKLVYNIVRQLMSEVSTLHKVSPHVLRHTFATSMLNGGAELNAVKELLGHSSLAATQVYTHTGFKELHNIYKRAHPRAK